MPTPPPPPQRHLQPTIIAPSTAFGNPLQWPPPAHIAGSWARAVERQSVDLKMAQKSGLDGNFSKKICSHDTYLKMISPSWGYPQTHIPSPSQTVSGCLTFEPSREGGGVRKGTQTALHPRKPFSSHPRA